MTKKGISHDAPGISSALLEPRSIALASLGPCLAAQRGGYHGHGRHRGQMEHPVWRRMDDIWRAWKGAGIDQDSLMSMMGWREDVINTIALYDSKDARLSFPTLEEVQTTLSDYFEEIA